MISTSTQYYINLLEKTNQQLSLWSNPYGVLVSILSFLIAFLAIVFAFILWRQGREYKEAFKLFLDEQKKTADGELQKILKQAKADTDKQIASSQKKLNQITDLKSQAKEKIENEIENLKKKREALEAAEKGTLWVNNPASTVYANNVLSNTTRLDTWTDLLATHLVTCYHCGHTATTNTNYCSKCGNKLP